MPTLLLTGATGMLGREVLARAAADPRFDRILCLVRPPFERFDTLLATPRLRLATHISAVAGDVTAPALGIGHAADLADVTHVVHCAATVRFDHPLEEARRINVEGARELIALCGRLPRLERLDAVSTCYVAGRRRDLATEIDLHHHCGFNNTYEQTKYEAEQLLRRAMHDLPIAVHRPSIVVGDSRTGETSSWKVLYWPLKILADGLLPAVPYDPGGRLDIVPVDFVVGSILALSRDSRTVGSTYHLAAGPSRDVTIGELADHLVTRLQTRKPWRIHPLLWRAVVRPALLALPFPRLRKTLRTALVYRPYVRLRVRFDTTGADTILGEAGIRCPRVLDYIDTIVDTAIAHDFGRKGVVIA